MASNPTTATSTLQCIPRRRRRHRQRLSQGRRNKNLRLAVARAEIINLLRTEIHERCRKDEGLMEAHIAANLGTSIATLKIAARPQIGTVRKRAAVFQERASFSKVAFWSHVPSQPVASWPTRFPSLPLCQGRNSGKRAKPAPASKQQAYEPTLLSHSLTHSLAHQRSVRPADRHAGWQVGSLARWRDNKILYVT